MRPYQSELLNFLSEEAQRGTGGHFLTKSFYGEPQKRARPGLETSAKCRSGENPVNEVA